MTILIELLEMFIGAFNYFFTPEDPNYTYFCEILCIFVLVTVLITSCLIVVSVVRGVFHLFRR
ncbi:MAG: hypothetical protein K2J08_09910 [Ruminococcus sp.]|nr:hypothetical protein [Ruminococcus sp.]